MVGMFRFKTVVSGNVRPDRPHYLAQVKPREPDALHPLVANVESWRSTFTEWQSGHFRSSSASLMRRNNSNLFPQARHWYS